MARDFADRLTASLRITAAPSGETARPEPRNEQSGPRPRDAALLRFPAVRARTGLSRSTIWRLEQGGLFPRRRRISCRAIAWAAEEVEAWSRSAAAGSDAPCDHRSERDRR
jgi:prophage regulatory protein